MPLIFKKTRDYTTIIPYILHVLPAVEQELRGWRNRAMAIPEPELRSQALASIEKKRFHCQGGSIYALYTRDAAQSLVRFIVAFQTISDYLDNLCDRVEGCNEAGFRTLHGAMLAAVDNRLPVDDWYRNYPLQGDDGYLRQLVKTSRETIVAYPGYVDIRDDLSHLVSLYCDLQVYKHLNRSLREEKLKHWQQRHRCLAPGSDWWEFAAATGSTLGVFALTAAAAEGKVSRMETERLLACYFPWICGIHILLDYFIDLDEDQLHGDLNFVAYYPSLQHAEAGLTRFLREAFQAADCLPRPAFHRTVVSGLLALYLSDPKAAQSGRRKITQQLLRSGGTAAMALYRVCLLLRRKHVV